jgi:hypothetical protein
MGRSNPGKHRSFNMLPANDRSWWRGYDGWEIQPFATEDLVARRAI